VTASTEKNRKISGRGGDAATAARERGTATAARQKKDRVRDWKKGQERGRRPPGHTAKGQGTPESATFGLKQAEEERIAAKVIPQRTGDEKATQ